MLTGQASWTQLNKLARQARLASAARQRLEVRLSPEESSVLARALETVLWMMSAMANHTHQPEWDLSEPNIDEMAHLAMQGGAFAWLDDDPDLYSDDDLKERFEWAAAL